MAIRALETFYQGYKFRSRLEARYAVFFDELGLKWIYEHEGFDVHGRWYLPDFYFPQLDRYGEVKPRLFTQEEFSLAASCGCIMFDGPPAVQFYSVGQPCGAYDESPYACYRSGHDYYRVELSTSLHKGRPWFCFGESITDYYTDTLAYAVACARQARFAHSGRA